MSTSHARIWVGIDAGKGHHWAVAMDADGETLFSTKVINDEAQILALIETACERADEVRWAVDISGRASTLLLALLIAHGQQVVYVPSARSTACPAPTGARARPTPRTPASSPTRPACARRTSRTPAELVSTLQVLTNYRADLIADRGRQGPKDVRHTLGEADEAAPRGC